MLTNNPIFAKASSRQLVALYDTFFFFSFCFFYPNLNCANQNPPSSASGVVDRHRFQISTMIVPLHLKNFRPTFSYVSPCLWPVFTDCTPEATWVLFFLFITNPLFQPTTFSMISMDALPLWKSCHGVICARNQSRPMIFLVGLSFLCSYYLRWYGKFTGVNFALWITVSSSIWNVRRCVICSIVIRRPGFSLILSSHFWFPGSFLSTPTCYLRIFAFCVQLCLHCYLRYHSLVPGGEDAASVF